MREAPGIRIVEAPWILLVLLLVGGLGVAMQQALNARTGRATSIHAATLVNFVGGTVFLGGALLVRGATSGFAPLFDAPWHLYLGGLVGVSVVAILARATASIGVLQLTLWFVAGQLLGALLFDLVAPTPGTSVTWWTVAGLALAFVAVAVSLERPGRRSRPPGH